MPPVCRGMAKLPLEKMLKKSSVSREVREYRPPVVNFNAQDYVDITDWNSTSITPPPVLFDFPDEQIESAIQNLGFVYDLLEYPCHTHKGTFLSVNLGS